MASSNLERNLREGIEAARRGDKLAARRLLQQVLQEDRSNEMALLWMASVVDTLPERRAYLEQVLRINPGNERARQALVQLGGTPPAPPKQAAGTPPPRLSTPPRPVDKPKRGMNPYFMAAISVAAAMVLIVIVFLLTQPGGPEPVAEAALATNTQPALPVVSPTPSRTPRPTATIAPVIVTLDPARQAALPATFTPTPTPEPTATLTPSATPLPLSSYPLLLAGMEPGDAVPRLYTALSDGSGFEEVGDDGGYYDIALSPDGAQIAFVRSAADEGSGTPSQQLFTAPVNDPTDVRQLTDLANTGMEHPAWSGDGGLIVFAANTDGDLELYRVPSNPDGIAEPEALTNNTATDSYPAFAPSGDVMLFVSDINTPGFLRLFSLSPDRGFRTFSNVSGNITGPAWSQDGRYVAYVNQQTSDADLFTINAEGQRPVQLTVNDTAADRLPVWSDDGQWIAFASDRSGATFMWYFLNVQTGAVMPFDRLIEAQSLVFLPR